MTPGIGNHPGKRGGFIFEGCGHKNAPADQNGSWRTHGFILTSYCDYEGNAIKWQIPKTGSQPKEETMHITEIRVRGYHLDVFGHVNNGRYLELLEEARWAIFDDKLDLESFARDGFMFTVVNINISYRSPALIHDILVIETYLASMGEHSAVIHQHVKNKKTGKTIVDADVTFVMLDVKTGKAALLEGNLKETLTRII
ncbi:acyl-CoA thioesterase [Desulfosarcina sp. OttesenSCG-928-G17]|nr:acyl-CoA thioesterase [Desulfosarcina sp. OttesenSCG-928-G17]